MSLVKEEHSDGYTEDLSRKSKYHKNGLNA